MIRWIIYIAVFALLVFAAVMIADLISLGFFRVRKPGDFDAGDAPGVPGAPVRALKKPIKNRVERQHGESCGGYASAYVLRHFGVEVTGEEVYSGMFKVWKGRVWVREVRRQLAKKGLATRYWRGDPDILRRELDKGDPVILVLNTSSSSLTLHFAVAVGYDGDEFFLADSAKPVRAPGPFNRIVSESELLEIWDTGSLLMPFHKFTYITAEPADSSV